MAITIEELLVKIGVDADNFDGGINGVTKTLDDLASRFGRAGLALTAGLTVPLVGLGKTALDAAGDMDSLKRGLVVVEGSAEGAERAFAKLRELAKLPGLGLQEVATASIRLKAAGFSAELAERAIKGFGNALAAVGSGRTELLAVVRQLQQMGNKPNVMAADLRPIMDAVPQVAGILKQAFGTIDTELIATKASAQEVINVIIAGLEKIPPVTGGIKNAIENFKDTWTIAMADVGKAIVPFAEIALNLASVVIPAIASAFTALPAPIQYAVVAFGVLLATVGPILLLLGGLAASVSAILGLFAPLAAGAATAAGGLTTLTGIASGLGTGLAGIAPIAAAVVGGLLYFQELSPIFSDLARQAQPLTSLLKELVTAFFDLGQSAAGSTSGLRKFGRELLTSVGGPLEEVLRAARGLRDSGLVSGLAGFAIGPPDVSNVRSRMASVVDQMKAETMKVFSDPNFATGAFGVLGIKSTAELTAELQKARTAYQSLVATGNQAPGVIEQARLKVKALEEALYGVSTAADANKKLFLLFDAIPFAKKSVEGELLAASIKSIADEHKKLIEQVAAARAASGSMLDIPLPTISGAGVGAMSKKDLESLGLSGGNLAELAPELKELTKSTEEAQEAFKTLGITKVRSADEMMRAYEDLKRTGIASTRELLLAEKAALEAKAEEYRATGQKITSEEAKRLAQLETLVGDSSRRVKKSLIDVSTVITDLSKGINDVLWGGGKGNTEGLQKAEDAAEAAYHKAVEQAGEEIKQRDDVSAAWKAYEAIQKRIAALPAGSPSLDRMQASAAAAKERYEELLKAAQATVETSPAVVAAYENWQKAQEELANPGFWNRFQSMVVGVFTEIGKAITRNLIEGLLMGEDGKGGLFGGLFSDLGETLGGLFGGKKKEGGLLKNILGGGALGGLFGGKKGGTSTTDLSGMFGQMLGGGEGAEGLAGTASGLGATFSNPVTGTIAAVAAVVDAVSGIISGFRMEGTLNAIEHEVRYSQIHLSNILEKLNEYLPKLGDLMGYLWDVQATYLSEMNASLQALADPLAGTQLNTAPALAGVSGAQPLIVAALVADDANMETFAKRLMEIMRNHGVNV